MYIGVHPTVAIEVGGPHQDPDLAKADDGILPEPCSGSSHQDNVSGPGDRIHCNVEAASLALAWFRPVTTT